MTSLGLTMSPPVAISESTSGEKLAAATTAGAAASSAYFRAAEIATASNDITSAMEDKASKAAVYSESSATTCDKSAAINNSAMPNGIYKKTANTPATTYATAADAAKNSANTNGTAAIPNVIYNRTFNTTASTNDISANANSGNGLKAGTAAATIPLVNNTGSAISTNKPIVRSSTATDIYNTTTTTLRASASDDDLGFKDLRRHSNGYARIRPYSLQDERILEKARVDTLAHIEENSTEVVPTTDTGRPLTVPPRRSKSSFNGRLSGSVQMLNGEGTADLGDTPPSGGKGTPRPLVKQSAMGTTGDEGLSSPETFRRAEENSSTSAISDIPNNSRSRNHLNNSVSPGNSFSNDSSATDRRVESTPINAARPNDKGIQASTVPKAAKAQKGTFVKVFPDIAEVDTVIKSYHCALVGDILLQGYLYVTSKWFCFHSKLTKKRIAIPVSMVMNISKKKTAIIIPNAISIVTAKEKFLFGSLMSRDNTYDLMHEVWKQNQQSQQDDLEQNIDNAVEEDQILSKSMTSTHTNSSEDSVTLASSSDSYSSPLPSPGGPPDRHASAGRAEGQGLRPGHACSCLKHSTPQRVGLSGSTHLESTSILGSVFRTPLTFWTEIMTWIKSLPRNFLILSISTLLVIFLLFSALLLAYKLLQLQTNIRPSGEAWAPYPSQFSSNPSSPPGWRPETDQSHLHQRVREADEELMFRRQEYHFTAIEKINSVLESHIHMLDQINEAMRSLKQLASSTCFQTSTAQVTSDDDSASSVIGETQTNELHDEM